MKSLTLKAVNAAIAEKYPGVYLCEADSTFYLWSDDDDLQLQIAGLFTASIDVYRIGHLSIDQWMSRVDYVLNDMDRLPGDRCPVVFKK